jgi:hypothetical protein
MEASRIVHAFVPGRPHWWQWLTVLSLDAPLVAVAWQAELAHAARVPLAWHHTFILGAAVWLTYVADRWIEGWHLDPGRVQTQRHWFYQRWRWPAFGTWVAVMFASVAAALTLLNRAELLAGFFLLAPVLVYLLSHQLVHRHHRWRAPKEICVALLFAVGVACLPAANRPAMLATVAVPLVLFGLLCFADCALISLWEDEVDRTHGQTSLALQFPQGRPFVRALPWIIAALAAGFASHESLAPREASWCAAVSGLLLGAVDLAHRRLGRQLTRAMVDVTLMTPFVPWLLAANLL